MKWMEWMQNGRKSHDSHFIKNVIMLGTRRARKNSLPFNSRHHIAVAWRVFCVCEREKNFRKQNLCKIATGLMHALLCSFIPVRFLIVLVIFNSSLSFFFGSIFHLFHQFLHNLLERNSFTIEYKWNVFIRVQL